MMNHARRRGTSRGQPTVNVLTKQLQKLGYGVELTPVAR
jgi:hypothetical protein